MNSFSYELIIFNGFAKSIIDGIVSSSIYKAQWFFRDEAIHVVCRVSEKLLQRSRWDFLRRHHILTTLMSRLQSPFLGPERIYVMFETIPEPLNMAMGEKN